MVSLSVIPSAEKIHASCPRNSRNPPSLVSLWWNGNGSKWRAPRDDLPSSQRAPVCRRAPPPRRPDGLPATSHRPAVPLFLISKPSHLLFAAAPSTHFLP